LAAPAAPAPPLPKLRWSSLEQATRQLTALTAKTKIEREFKAK
jgi:hypothetical protein